MGYVVLCFCLLSKNYLYVGFSEDGSFFLAVLGSDHFVHSLFLICDTFDVLSFHYLFTVLPNIRDGILVHTGNWTTSEVNIVVS